jgi:putative MFS transporter
MLPLSISSITEIAPLYLRGKMILLVNSFVSVGKLFAIFLCYLCFYESMNANWRLLMFLNGIITFIAPLLCYYLLLESARFHIASGEFE